MEYTSTSSIAIPNVTPEQIWEALTNPEIVKQYFFGTTVESDWQVGSPITYSGVWENKPYEDKGTVLEVEPKCKLVTSYWSAAFGPDTPENRKTVTYEITPTDGGTILTITQDNTDESSKKHSEKNWNMVLDELKKLLTK